MPSINDILHQGKLQLKSADIESANLDARILLEHVLDVEHTYLIRYGDEMISNDVVRQYHTLLCRRIDGEPVGNILGYREFWSLNFLTNEHTLEPRPDSETLIESVLKYQPNRSVEHKILDIGTGTGCLLLSLLSEYPKATGVGVDISDPALVVAQKNASQLGLSSRVEFIKNNWVEEVKGRFDIIISNPPYIPSVDIAHLAEDVRNFDPHLALDGGEDGLNPYRKIIPKTKSLLKEGGIAVFEFGQGQEEDIEKICADSGLQIMGFRKDLAGITRCIVIG